MIMTGIYGNPNGDRGLIASILNQAIDDMLAYPHPDLSGQKKYRKDSAAYWSLDARRFVDASNPEFIRYCTLLDLDPKATEEGIYKFIRKESEFHSRMKSIPKKGKTCSANNAAILNLMLSELLTMMKAIQSFAEENVRAAA